MKYERKKKKSIEDEINEFLEIFGASDLDNMFEDFCELFKLFDCDDKEDWLALKVGAENAREVRLIRTCYLVSKIAEANSSKLFKIKTTFPFFYRKLEEHVKCLATATPTAP